MAKKETNKKKVSTKKTTTTKSSSKPKKVKVEKDVEVVTEEKVDMEEPEQNYITKDIPENPEEFKKDIITNVVKNMVIEEGEGILGNINEEHREEIIDKIKERIEDIKKINNDKVNNRIDNVFGYLWNGQEMDY